MVLGHALKSSVYVVAAKRTPFGAFGGSLKAKSPTDLQVTVTLFDLLPIHAMQQDGTHLSNGPPGKRLKTHSSKYLFIG